MLSPISSGSASVSRNPSGRAPLAARSERFTRSAFLATVSGGSSGKKCTPPTMPSDGEHEIAARGRRERRGIIDQAERAGMFGERPEIARDQALLAGCVAVCFFVIEIAPLN